MYYSIFVLFLLYYNARSAFRYIFQNNKSISGRLVGYNVIMIINFNSTKIVNKYYIINIFKTLLEEILILTRVRRVSSVTRTDQEVLFLENRIKNNKNTRLRIIICGSFGV